MEMLPILARIAREGFFEALELYFEPLLKVWAWWKRFRFARKAASQRLDMAVLTMETLAEKIDKLMPLLQSQSSPIQVEELMVHFLKSRAHWDSKVLQVLSRFEAEELAVHHLALEEIYKPTPLWLLEDRARESFDKALAFGEKATAIRDALLHVEDSDPRIIRLYGFQASGESRILGTLQIEEVTGSVAHLLETVRELREPGVLKPTKKFEIYLEVATFLAQRGYSEAAAAVMTRAFRLPRFLEGIPSGRRGPG